MTEIEKRRINELREAGLGYKSIAKQMDININTVKVFCHKAYYSFICPHFGNEFQTYGEKRRKYCSHECYIKERFGK